MLIHVLFLPIHNLVPILLNALDDPANKTQKCLDTMLTTKFVHFIDSPSLALIMPVIERAFQARSTKTRKAAAQIIGKLLFIRFVVLVNY